MRKFITFMAACFIAAATFAQESNRDANGRIQFGPYETNSFFSNWFVDAGAGVNVPVDNITNIFRKGQKIEADFGGLALYGNVGKWFDPCFGARIGWQGLTSGKLGVNNHVKSFVWWPNSENQAFNFVHGDFMVNVSNLFAGYKETRAVDVVPYLTAGGIFTKSARTLAVGGGIQVPVRVSNVVSIVPQVQALALDSKIFGGANVVLQTTASVGVRVNLGKNNWVRVSTHEGQWSANLADAIAAKNIAEANLKFQNTRISEDQERIEKLIRENDRLVRENDVLRNNENVPNFDTATFYFEIGKSVLSPEQLAQLDYFANNIMKNGGKLKFYVAGATDTATGSVKRNAELRKARAKYVYNYLSNKFGVSNIEESEEVLEDVGVTPELSRAVVISNK